MNSEEFTKKIIRTTAEALTQETDIEHLSSRFVTLVSDFEKEIRQDQKEKCVDILCGNNFPLPIAHDEGLNMVNPNPSLSRRAFFTKLIIEAGQ